MFRWVFTGFILALLTVVACGTVQYKWYGLELRSYQEGNLRGPKEKDDLPVIVCRPDASSKLKCVVMLLDEFDRFKADHIQCKVRLKECERSR